MTRINSILSAVPTPQKILAMAGMTLLLSGCGNSLMYEKISTKKACDCKKNSYWYNDKCWKNYEDERLPPEDVSSIVAEQMKEIKSASITVGSQTHPLTGFFPFPEGKKVLILATYSTPKGEQTLLSQTGKLNLVKKKFKSKVIQFNGNILAGDIDTIPSARGTASFNRVDDTEDYQVSGNFENGEGEPSIPFSYTTNEGLQGAGTSKLEIKGNEAFLSGDLGTITFYQIERMVAEHPEVKTLVLTQISGSINDQVNVHTGRLVRKAGLTTKVLADSEIASGGVDLFCAGKERIVEKGARIGIHSWCCFNDLTAIELPKDHPAHQDQIQYFTLMMGPENGPAFYFKTLEAAEFDGIYWMTDQEIIDWKVATTFKQ